jgi:DNA adenine methylase
MIKPKPFLKSAGGKRRLVNPIASLVSQSGFTGKYIEPFLGGGAVFLDLHNRKLLKKKRAFLADACLPIAHTWQHVQDDPQNLMADVDDIALRIQHADRDNPAQDYDAFRWEFNDCLLDNQVEAGSFLWLNHTCFNGLTRFNANGEFNVPFGKYKNPTIYNKENILAVTKALKHAKIRHEGFLQSLDRAQPGDICYIDPPYIGQFDGYTPEGFGRMSQVALAACLRDLSNKDVKIIASNSNLRATKSLYADFMQIKTVSANTKSLNSNTDDRAARNELLMYNFSATL